MGKSNADLTRIIANSVHICTVVFSDISPNPIDVYGDQETGEGRVCCSGGRLSSWETLVGVEPAVLAQRVAALKHPGTIEWHNGFDPKAPVVPA